MAAKTNFHLSAEIWLSWEGRTRYETSNYTLRLSGLTEEELLNLAPIPADMIVFAPQMFHVVAPRQHPKLKATIAYLTELHERQTVAWQNFLARCVQEAQKTDEQIFEIQSRRYAPRIS